ncbi:Hypothetical protein SCLAV_2139 [Streptomyces clavuligerus]|uniref:Uncharacterized protein n=1 Tax=Streptomyces clavuligerus TaxID=1901 RepID=E2Q688_STRCL|nr:Hypothetical protein SCLAV_2139 [Streptomyces clavuligerus]
MEPWILNECDHQYEQWSGAQRCIKCGHTQR